MEYVAVEYKNYYCLTVLFLVGSGQLHGMLQDMNFSTILHELNTDENDLFPNELSLNEGEDALSPIRAASDSWWSSVYNGTETVATSMVGAGQYIKATAAAPFNMAREANDEARQTLYGVKVAAKSTKKAFRSAGDAFQSAGNAFDRGRMLADKTEEVLEHARLTVGQTAGVVHVTMEETQGLINNFGQTVRNTKELLEHTNSTVGQTAGAVHVTMEATQGLINNVHQTVSSADASCTRATNNCVRLVKVTAGGAAIMMGLGAAYGASGTLSENTIDPIRATVAIAGSGFAIAGFGALMRGSSEIVSTPNHEI